MAIIEPKYDNEQITYGFLKKILSKNLEDSSQEQIKYSKSFSTPPNPPYYIGWTYTQNNKIYRCIKDRLLGSFSIEDWIVLYDEKQNNLIAENFLFLSEVELGTQNDNKIETFYQEEDPSADWDTSVLKSNHENDYWRTKIDGVYHSYIYTKMATNPITWDWIEINVPICIFDTINGHKSIYTDIPTKYIKNDFLKIVSEDMLKYFPDFNYEVGDYLYTTVSNDIFDQKNWLKKEDELSLKSLQSYYYTTDEINKIVEIINAGIESDIKKSKDSITAYVKESYTEKTTTEEIKKKVDANGKTIEEIKGTNTTEIPTLNLSQLSIALDQISEEVKKSINLTNTISNQNKLVISNAMKGNLLSLKISGNMSLIFPSKKLFPSKNLFGKNSDLIIEYDDGTSEKVKLPIKRLRTLNDVSDEFIIDSNGTRLIKKIGVTEDNQEYILSEEEVINYDDIYIPLKNGTNTIYLSSFKNNDLSFYCEYAIQNKFNDTFATKLEMASKILASADGILLETQKKIELATEVSKLVSSINLSPEDIKLLAKKIIFEGLVTANENFKILLDGSMEAKNGNFKGHIEAESGSFKGHVEADSGSFKGHIEAESGSFKGNIYLEDGNVVIGGNGMLTTKMIDANLKSQQFVGANVLLPMGFSYSGTIFKDFLEFNIEIPQDFYIISAYIILDHVPVEYYESGTYKYTGYSRNLKLYKSRNKLSSKLKMDYGYANVDYSNANFMEVENTFGANGFTGSSTSGDSVQSTDIKNYLDKGFNLFKIESANANPSDYDSCFQQSGACKATMYINGYTKFS